jgi:hypothetical protein
MRVLKHTIYYLYIYLGFDFGEEVIYSQESPKMEESFKDLNWDLNRFVEYRSPFTRKETLPIKKPI